MNEEEYVKTEMKEQCVKCLSNNTTTYTKRVYILTLINDDGFKTEVEMPHLKYKQICNECAHKNIYFL